MKAHVTFRNDLLTCLFHPCITNAGPTVDLKRVALEENEPFMLASALCFVFSALLGFFDSTTPFSAAHANTSVPEYVRYYWAESCGRQSPFCAVPSQDVYEREASDPAGVDEPKYFCRYGFTKTINMASTAPVGRTVGL